MTPLSFSVTVHFQLTFSFTFTFLDVTGIIIKDNLLHSDPTPPLAMIYLLTVAVLMSNIAI